VGQLFFIGHGGFGVERVVHRHGHLAGHLSHELDGFFRVGVAGQRAEVEPADFPLRGKQRQYTGRLYAVGAQYLTDDRESRFFGGVRDVVRTAGLERGDGGSLFERRALGRLARNWPLGFQNVQAYHALFGVDQGKADEIKLHQAFQQAAEVGEEGGELAVGDDGFGYFEKRLVAFPGGVRMERCGGWHQGVEPAFPTVPQAGI
jgi:hypothetical protein